MPMKRRRMVWRMLSPRDQVYQYIPGVSTDAPPQPNETHATVALLGKMGRGKSAFSDNCEAVFLNERPENFWRQANEKGTGAWTSEAELVHPGGALVLRDCPGLERYANFDAIDKEILLDAAKCEAVLFFLSHEDLEEPESAKELVAFFETLTKIFGTRPTVIFTHLDEFDEKVFSVAKKKDLKAVENWAVELGAGHVYFLRNARRGEQVPEQTKKIIPDILALTCRLCDSVFLQRRARKEQRMLDAREFERKEKALNAHFAVQDASSDEESDRPVAEPAKDNCALM